MTAQATALKPMAADFDVAEIRRDFPVFGNNPGLVFLDSAASAQKPRAVIQSITEFYESHYANVHRGVYALSQRATDRFEAGRERARLFLNARDSREIVFVRGATEAINLVANTWGAKFLKPGDEVLITELEHHANIVPWQLLRERTGLNLVVAPIDATGGLDLAAFEARLSSRTKLVAVTHLANAIGTLVPVEAIIKLAHARGAKVLIDGCQAAPRMPVDVRALDCDFYVFSGHKTYGPTGTGVLYGKLDVLETMPPWQGGGDMIETVTFEETTFQQPPHRFEAGTPDITGAHALGVALDYIDGLGRDRILAHEQELTAYGVDLLSGIRGVKLMGAGQQRLGVLSFDVDGVHPHDLGTVLDQHQVAVRTGQHCAQPLLERLGVPATVRASFGVYSDEADLDRLAEAIREAQRFFKA